MKKIILLIAIFIFSFGGVNAGFDCKAVLKDKTYKNQSDKIYKIYEKINNLPIERRSKLYIEIQESLGSGGKISKYRHKIQEKYGFDSNEYKKITFLYDKIYCYNQELYNKIIENFFNNFESIKDNNYLLNNKKIIRYYYDTYETFNKTGDINVNKKTFIILKLEDKLGIAVDKNFLYFYKKGWPENIKNILKIKNYKSFKIYDGLLLGDDSFFMNGERYRNINLKEFKRINKKSIDYRNVEDYFYYEDDAYFYQKRNWDSLEKIGLKAKKIEILSKNTYIYDNKIYYFKDVVLEKNIEDFKIVNNKVLFGEDNLMSIEIFGRDDKYIYLKSSSYGTNYFGKLELDYSSLVIIDEKTIKDKNNTFEFIDWKIIKK